MFNFELRSFFISGFYALSSVLYFSKYVNMPSKIAHAVFRRYFSVFKSFSSSGLDKKPHSIITEGISVFLRTQQLLFSFAVRVFFSSRHCIITCCQAQCRPPKSKLRFFHFSTKYFSLEVFTMFLYHCQFQPLTQPYDP